MNEKQKLWWKPFNWGPTLQRPNEIGSRFIAKADIPIYDRCRYGERDLVMYLRTLCFSVYFVLFLIFFGSFDRNNNYEIHRKLSFQTYFYQFTNSYLSTKSQFIWFFIFIFSENYLAAFLIHWTHDHLEVLRVNKTNLIFKTKIQDEKFTGISDFLSIRQNTKKNVDRNVKQK